MSSRPSAQLRTGAGTHNPDCLYCATLWLHLHSPRPTAAVGPGLRRDDSLFRFSKYPLDPSVNPKYIPTHPAPHEGRIMIVTARWRGWRWTLAASGVSAPDENAAAYGEVVWSWRRDPGVYPLRLCGDGNGGKKGRSPGRARINRKTIARGRPGRFGCTCQIRVHSFSTSAHGNAGAVGARLSLRPCVQRIWQNVRTGGCAPTARCWN